MPQPDAPRPQALHHDDDDHPEIAARNSKYGLILFAVYLLLYGGFMLLTAFDPKRMAEPSLFGVTLAVVYGFGLIVAALVLAGIYMYLCRGAAADAAATGGNKEAGR
jgi:uncharacterized membrane protein (DUF485 family)